MSAFIVGELLNPIMANCQILFELSVHFSNNKFQINLLCNCIGIWHGRPNALILLVIEIFSPCKIYNKCGEIANSLGH